MNVKNFIFVSCFPMKLNGNTLKITVLKIQVITLHCI